MSFRISPGVPFGDDIRRIAIELIEGAIADGRPGSTTSPETIHAIRKRCKKLRAVLRLVRPCLGHAYQQENEYFRDVANILAPLRDVHAMVAAFDAVVGGLDGEVEPATFLPLRRRLARRERRRTGVEERLADVRRRMEAARERVAAWPLDDPPAPEAWGIGFEGTYRRARRALAAAYQEPAAERFHEWRKSVKYHWYHVRLLAPLWPEACSARAGTASALGELLGSHHDLAVLRAALGGSPGLTDASRSLAASFVALIDRHQAHVEAAARPLGIRLFAEKPSRIGARYEKYWTAWRDELQGPAAPTRLAAAASG